jgi:hypothetical protein
MKSVHRSRILIIIPALIMSAVFSQVQAQTHVEKVNALKSNDYGIQYVLPKTILKVNVEYNEIRQKSGIYAKYASLYLRTNDSEVITEDQTYYTLGAFSIIETSIPNKSQTYFISFKPKTIAPFVYLREDGVICSINGEYRPDGIDEEKKAPVKERSSSLPDINPQSIFTEEYLRAGSVGKMAEVAAKNIYKIRESRQDILTGEVDNVPKDGEAMKIILGNLAAQEKLWTELFTGSSETIKHTKQFSIEPNSEISKEILFRFSKYLGIVGSDDLSGSPIYVNIKDLKSVEISEPDPKKKVKEAQSIVYNVPGKAEVEIYNGLNPIYSTTVNMTQFGTTQILATSLFEDKKAPVQVFFYPNTGAIKQIIQ